MSSAVVQMTFGEVDYRRNGVVVVPVTFRKSVIIPSKTIFIIENLKKVVPVFKDAEAPNFGDIEYLLLGKGADWELHFKIPENLIGSFDISVVGSVLVSGAYASVKASPVSKSVSFYNVEPVVLAYDVPSKYRFGENFDVKVAFNATITGWHLDNTFTEIWIEEGARLGKPTPYKYVGADPSDVQAFLQEDLSALDDAELKEKGWQKLAAIDASLPKTAENHFDGDFWHGEEGKIFMFRIEVTNADASGIAQFALRPDNPIRGPVVDLL